MTKREVFIAMKQQNDLLIKMLKTAVHGKPK